MGHLIGRFMHKFKSIMDNARLEPLRHMLARLLGLSPKNSVTTANIGHHRVAASLYVAQSDPMFLTRFATILIAGSFRKETAENAMFGVENGQVLVGNDFELIGANALC